MKSPGLDLPERGGGLLPCLTRSLAPPRRLPIRASPTLLGWALWMTNQTLSPTAYTLTLTHTHTHTHPFPAGWAALRADARWPFRQGQGKEVESPQPSTSEMRRRTGVPGPRLERRDMPKPEPPLPQRIGRSGPRSPDSRLHHVRPPTPGTGWSEGLMCAGCGAVNGRNASAGSPHP